MFELTVRSLNNLGYIIALAFFFTKFESARDIFTKKNVVKKISSFFLYFFHFFQ